MDIKEIRQKGFEFFENNGRMPVKLIINRKDFGVLVSSKDANKYLKGTKDKTYFDDLEVIINNSIEGFEAR